METSGITSGNHDIYTGIKIHLHVVERAVTVINVKKKKVTQTEHQLAHQHSEFMTSPHMNMVTTEFRGN